ERYVESETEAGAEVRLSRACVLVPQSGPDSNDGWVARKTQTKQPEIDSTADQARPGAEDRRAATRFGPPASQLKQFIDTTSGPWVEGQLAGKPATVLTSTTERHGGQEATLLSLHHTLFHWGATILPTGYVDYALSHAAGGNPYGVSAITGDAKPDEHVLALARFQGQRMAKFASVIASMEMVPA